MSDLSTFDPGSVPVRPVIDISFDHAPDGREIAVVDGHRCPPEPGESPREAAIRAAAALVDRVSSVDASGRRSPALRARVHGDDDAVQELVVHRQGRVFVAAAPPAAPVPPAPEEPPVQAPAHPVPVAGTSAAPARAGEPINRWPGATLLASLAPPPRKSPAAASPATATTVPTAAVTPPETRAGTGGPDAADPGWSATFLDGLLTRTTDTPAPASPGRPDETDRAARVDGGTPDAAAAPDTPDGEPAPAGAVARPAPRSHPDGAELHRSARSDRPRRTGRADRRPRAERRPEASPPAPPAPAGPVSARPARLPRPRRVVRIRPTAVAVAAAALVVLVAAATLLLSLDRGGARAPGTTPSAGTPLPVAAPPGWLDRSRWVSPALLAEAGAVVTVDDAIGYVTQERRMTVVDAMTGTARWASDLPEGPVHGPPARTRVGGEDVLAAHVGEHLVWWRTSDGRETGRIALPASARATFHGAAPLLGLDRRTVGVVRDGTLTRVALPGGATPLAASEDGTVTAAAPEGWWHLRSDVAPALPTPWEDDDPEGGGAPPRSRVVGYAGGSILTLRAPDRTGRAHVVAHTDRPDAVRVSFRGIAAGAETATGPDPKTASNAEALRWSPSPSGTWGVLGRTLVDVRAGRVDDLGEWSTRQVTQDRAYGRVADQVVVAGPGLARGALPPGASAVEATSRAGAAVRVARDGAEVVHFLPPAQ